MQVRIRLFLILLSYCTSSAASLKTLAHEAIGVAFSDVLERILRAGDHGAIGTGPGDLECLPFFCLFHSNPRLLESLNPVYPG
jgi:hypothetical protein